MSHPHLLQRLSVNPIQILLVLMKFQVSILKIILLQIAIILEHIFNFFLKHGIFSDAWKSALICKIPKVKNPIASRDYHSIAILYQKSSNALSTSKCRTILTITVCIIPASRHRRDHSTQSSLIRILNDIQYVAGKKMITIYFSLICYKSLIG